MYNPKYGHLYHGVKCRLMSNDWLFHLYLNKYTFQGKLDSYRDILKRGKALNEDQQSAVDKYDEVNIKFLQFTDLHHIFIFHKSDLYMCDSTHDIL